MSDGGLLQKATNQRSDNDATNELVAATIIPNSQDSDMSSLKDVAITLSYGAVLPFFVVMWFGVYLDFISLTILSPLVMISSLAFVWWKLNLGLPAFAGGNGLDMKKSFAIFSTYILLLGIPLLLATLLVGDISLGDVSFDDSGDELEVKIRQNGGSGSHDASVTLYRAGSEVFSDDIQFDIDRSDGLGEYGIFTIATSDFYSGNALPSSEYTMDINIDNGDTVIQDIALDSLVLSRDVTSVYSTAKPSMSESSDDCGSMSRCVSGISLSAYIGISSLDSIPGALPYADYSFTTTLSLDGNSVAIEYPTVTVEGGSSSTIGVFGLATWDSMGGQYGGGTMSNIGLYGSEISLMGSESNIEIGEGNIVIPKSDWSESDYGCYTLSVSVNDGTNEVNHESYYIYDESESSEESWTNVNSC
ncbi:hypothetical protein N8809_03965 [Euryarchaeota archaeon]|jgi:hypothetical protein|nr:hypothetical protein [Euryarchaeota archaeon]